MIAVLALCAGLGVGAVTPAAGQEAAYRPLYDAARTGEPARVWSYDTANTRSTIWISVARGLPITVQARGVLQTSIYQATPFPKP